MVSEPRVTWAAFVPILVFLSLSVLDLGPMYATDRRQTDARQKHRFRLLGAGHNNWNCTDDCVVIFDDGAFLILCFTD